MRKGKKKEKEMNQLRQLFRDQTTDEIPDTDDTDEFQTIKNQTRDDKGKGFQGYTIKENNT